MEFQSETGHGTGVTAGFYSRIASALSSRAAALNAPMALIEGPVAAASSSSTATGSGQNDEDEGDSESKEVVTGEVNDLHALRLDLNAVGMPIGWSPAQQAHQDSSNAEKEARSSLPYRVASLASHALCVPGSGGEVDTAPSLEVVSWRRASAITSGDEGEGSEKNSSSSAKKEGKGAKQERGTSVEVRCTQPVWQMSASGEVRLQGDTADTAATAGNDDDEDDLPDLEAMDGSTADATTEGAKLSDATASSSSSTAALEFPLVAVLRPTLFPGTFTVAGTRGNASTALHFRPSSSSSAVQATQAAGGDEDEDKATPYRSLTSVAGGDASSSSATSFLPSVGDTLELWPASQGAQGRFEGSVKVAVLALKSGSSSLSDSNGIEGGQKSDDIAEVVVSGDLTFASTSANKEVNLLGAPYAPPLWVGDAASASGASLGSLECPGGLFPAPFAPGVSGRDKAMLRKQFQFLGRLFGKVRYLEASKHDYSSQCIHANTILVSQVFLP